MTTKITRVFNLAKDTVLEPKEKKLNVQLIKGEFSPIDAADILLSIINDKIKFHTVRELSQANLNGQDMFNSQNRIHELKQSKKEITDLILKARNDNCHLELDSTINITLRRNPN